MRGFRLLGRILRRGPFYAMLLLAAAIGLALIGFPAGATAFVFLACGLGIAGGVVAALRGSLPENPAEGSWLADLVEGLAASDSGDGSGGDGGGGDGGGGDGGGGGGD
ncbi:MAG: hypothetical protein LDL25_04025 [Hyphomicrobiales bacterium]|nr:hypothetical protein [Hyphomicrobiales bacterium]